MIKNINKDIVIKKDSIYYCNSYISKIIGLMFSINKNKALIFNFKKETHTSLHMFFVFFSIDVLFLNKDKKIIEIKENFKPFSFYYPKNKFHYVIELPKNIIKETNTEMGDVISF